VAGAIDLLIAPGSFHEATRHLHAFAVEVVISVPAQEQAELKAIVDSTRADIVVKLEAAATS
jgi:predicted subunit of tRNA(5-methylaminomethyl-2-thiouridylate) methyltransferase